MSQELVLELVLGLPSTVLDGDSDIGGVAAGGVGEDPAGRLSDRNVHLLSLLLGVLPNEVHLVGLVGFGGQSGNGDGRLLR